jgi:acylphosphatase
MSAAEAAARRIVQVFVRGRVQGVGFRAFVEYAALRRGLEGWVRNRRDGRVEAVFAGLPAAVDAIVAECREGPPGSRVDHLTVNDGGPDLLASRLRGELFSVLATV